MGKCLVYHEIFKLGVVDEGRINDKLLDVSFVNGVRTINNPMGLDKNPYLKYLSKETLNKLTPEYFDQFFSYSTICKAEELKAITESIRIIDKDKISGRVISSSLKGSYLCNISFENNTITARCSCPVGKDCKHTYKIISAISDTLNNLSSCLSNEEKNIISYMQTGKNERVFFLNYLYFNKIKTYFDNNCSHDNLKKIIDVIDRNEGMKAKYNAVLFIVSYCLGNNKDAILEELYNKDLNSLKQAKEYILGLNEISSNKEDNFFYLIKLLFSNKYDILLHLLASEFKEYRFEFLNDLISHCEPSKFVVEDVKTLSYSLYIDIEKNNLNRLVPFMDEKTLDYFIGRYPKKISIDFNNISFERGLNFLARMNENEIFSFQKKYLSEINLNQKAVIETLFNAMYLDNYDSQLGSRLINILVKLDNAPYYILPFISLSANSNFVREYASLYGNLINDIDYSKLSDFFHFEVEKNEMFMETDLSNNDFILNKYFYILSNENKLPYNALSYGKQFLKKDTYKEFFNQFERCMNNSLKEEIDKIIEERNLIIQEKIMKEKEKDLFYYLTDKESKDEDNAFASIKKSEELILDLSIGFDYSISIKAGYDKLYKVKDVKTFIENFKLKDNYDFGRGKSVICSIDDLDEEGKFIYDVLVRNCYENFDTYYHQDYAISKEGVSRLISRYDGLKIEDNMCKVHEEKEVLFYVDENYKLHMEPHIEIDDILVTNDLTYHFDLAKKALYPIYGGGKTSDIINFFSKFNGVSIERNIPLFLDNIYHSNEDIIRLDRPLEYGQQKYNIELYFDMTDGIISVSKKVYEDDKIVKNVSDSKVKNSLYRINDLLINLGFDEGGRMDKEDKITSFLTTDLSPLKKICKIFYSETLTKSHIVRLSAQNLRFSYNNDMMSVFFEESLFDEKELEKIYSSIKKKKKYVQLKDKRLVNIDTDEARKFYELATELNLDKDHLLHEQEIQVYNAFKVMDEFKVEEAKDKFVEIIEEVKDFKNNKINEKCVNASLRDYQIDGVNWMHALAKNNLGGILADDMGLGKTLQTITLLKNDSTSRPSLIVCPKSLIFNWANEFSRFDNETKVIRVIGNYEERQNIILNMKEDEKVIYITSYDSLRNDIENYKYKFEYLFLDEAQAIKTATSKKAQVVKQINTKHKFALTGTPIENNVLELWSIFDFLLPGYLGDVKTFKSRFENEENYKEIVAKRIAMFILRRTKKDVLKDLPEKYERIVTAEMNTEQRKLYDSYCVQAKKMIDENADVFQVLPILMRLRQICVDPRMFVEDYSSSSGKMEILKESIISLVKEGHKVLVFSQFKKALNGVEIMLKELGMDYYMLTGDTSAEERVDLCERFNTNNVPVFLITLKAGGNGLNLFGADTVIHLDPWWNAAAQDQATDRAYRIGQKNNVNVIKIICDNSIEEKVLELQNIKKDLIDSLIAKDEKSILKLTQEDIKFILGD